MGGRHTYLPTNGKNNARDWSLLRPHNFPCTGNSKNVAELKQQRRRCTAHAHATLDGDHNHWATLSSHTLRKNIHMILCTFSADRGYFPRKFWIKLHAKHANSFSYYSLKSTWNPFSFSSCRYVHTLGTYPEKYISASTCTTCPRSS